MLDAAAMFSDLPDPPVAATRKEIAVPEAWPAAFRRAEPALPSGYVLDGRYDVRRTLGHGGAATVYRAWDRILGTTVALKVFQINPGADRETIRRLTREVRLARRVRHPNVCSVFDVGFATGFWFLTMEEATGGSLRDQLRAASDDGRRASRSVDPWQNVADAAGISSGLAAIHAMGIAHCDVTPRNVLRMADGRLVLADFGLAYVEDEGSTLRGGTLKYLAPEVALGGTSNRASDVWQLGMVMYELLFGVTPRWTVRRGRTICERVPARDTPAAWKALVALCEACLALDPRSRPSALQVSRTLAAGGTGRIVGGGRWRRLIPFWRDPEGR